VNARVGLLATVSDTLVAYKLMYDNCVYVWDVSTSRRTALLRVRDEIITILATPQADVIVGTKQHFFMIRPTNLHDNQVLRPQYKLYHALDPVVHFQLYFKAFYTLRAFITLTSGTVVAIADNYVESHMLFVNLYNQTEWHVALPYDVTCLVALPDNQLASGNIKGDVHIWNADGVCMQQLLTCGSIIRELAWNVDMLAVCTNTHVEKYRHGVKVSSIAHDNIPFPSGFAMLEDYTIVMGMRGHISAWNGPEMMVTAMSPLVDFGHCRIVAVSPYAGLHIIE
jgi:WD40 repeat protein